MMPLSLLHPAWITATTAALLEWNNTCCALDSRPHTATERMIGTSSLVVMFTVDHLSDHCALNQ